MRLAVQENGIKRCLVDSRVPTSKVGGCWCSIENVSQKTLEGKEQMNLFVKITWIET